MFYKIFGFFASFFIIVNAHAICVHNETEFQLYYEINNQNTHCPIPKVKFHSGVLQPNQKTCHAHSQAEGDDWRIYRFDLIKVYKINSQGEKEPACTKTVDGILNTLNVSYHPWSNTWWCLDRNDDTD
ncbi:hypothetical protein [Legionella hackeliae]|uniref:Secreted protein n=1 Tax=Legionella hackeliae TaxID=449 RepID=A0A0A8UVC7_LEGHA|nr:hypothetical protein [Legionella hackeliae]KTD15171.1 hypothetical protein Lhac_0013 [Legionella hackeliae]CEK11466.1 exported protein of unknown function [Legionella hackeliae]STX48236.1 Uncharacterised protein [Legionella hackeliae]